MKNETLDKIKPFVINSSKETVISEIKKMNHIPEIITKLNITDQEIWDNAINLIEYSHHFETKETNLFDYAVVRNDKKLKVIKTLSRNRVGNEFRKDKNVYFQEYFPPETNKTFIDLTLSPEFMINNYLICDWMERVIEDIRTKNIWMKGDIIYGNASSSRSLILSMLVNTFAISDVKAAYVNVNDLCDVLLNSFKSDINNIEKDKNTWEKELIEIPILVLDEIGFKKLKPWYLQFLYKVIKARNIKSIPTYFGFYNGLIETEIHHLVDLRERKDYSPHLTENLYGVICDAINNKESIPAGFAIKKGENIWR
ncbi:hypothetical protein [Mycoplasma nasistruthionis]|uniref:ATP-binding protein n=1 Tax=Mycoplasma nasistruthionis TaxID=353852 RepID=A0A4Y6I6J6_9MOLU|nr:hypothetical protein [Mycoplasma nasistruthionis]QDF64930.1 hypothetical protein FIV53_01230 [Mycoplasma nasistruthionis]